MSVAVQTEPVAPGKLIVAPADAAQWVLTQIERGQAIRKQKIRYVEDLEKARERKGEWVKQTNELLKGMFDTESVANEFNTWDVRVLPDYAEVGLFIELFYEEMDQRLARLQSVHRRIPPVAAKPQARFALHTPESAPPPAVLAAGVSSAAPASEGSPTPPAAPAGEADEAIADSSSLAHHGTCLLVMHGELPEAAECVSQFVSQLDFEPVRLQHDAGDSKAAIDTLEAHPDAAFAVILMNAETAAAARRNTENHDGAPLDPRLVFQLGYCVGKLGLRRVCVLFPDGAGAFCDRHGVLFVPIDSAGGWQLQVARQFKRSGIDIDMNRIC